MKYKVKILKQPKYQDGGNMQQQELDPEQIMQGVVTLLQEGTQPEEIAKQLIQMGIPQEQVIQIIQNVIQQLQGDNGQEEEQGQEQMQPGMQQQMGYGEEEEQGQEEDDTQMAAYGGQMGYGLDLGSRRLWMNQDDDEQSMVNRSIKEVPRDEANIEAEGGETALVPNKTGSGNSHFNIQGNRHTQGGVPLNVPEGTFIYSDTKKMKLGGAVLNVFGKSDKTSKKYTPAALAKQYNLNKYTAILESPKSSQLERRTAELMIQNYNKKLAQLALVQEGKKGYPQGIPKVAEEYYAKTKAYVEKQQASKLPNNNRMQYGGEGVDQDMEQGEQMQAMYGMGFKYGGGLQRFVYGSEFDGEDEITEEDVTNFGIGKNSKKGMLADSKISLPESDVPNNVYQPFNYNSAMNQYQQNLNGINNAEIPYLNNQNFTNLDGTPSGANIMLSNEMKKNPELYKINNDFTYNNNGEEDGNEFGQYKQNIGYGLSNEDKAAIRLAQRSLPFPGVRPSKSTIKLQRPETRYYDPSREIAAINEMTNADRQARNMFAGKQTPGPSYGTQLTGIVNAIGRNANQNIQLGNVAANQAADTNNKQMMFDAEQTKNYNDAYREYARKLWNDKIAYDRGVTSAQIQGSQNARDRYNANISESPYFASDDATGRIYFHSPKSRNAFYNQKTDNTNNFYASAWKMAQKEADEMDFKSDKERESYIDKAAEYYSKQFTPSKRKA